MQLLNYLKNLLRSSEEEGDRKQNTPEGYCPNCWGRYEYEGKIIKDLQDAHITLNNIEQKKGWIQAYTAEKLEGIKLEDKNIVKACPDCEAEFSEEASYNPEGGPQ